MRLRILGIGGAYMAGVALLARALGDEVSGCDAGVYPPMSELLASCGIPVHEGYDAACLEPPPHLVLIGNVLSRGNPAVEQVLERRLPYTSGPQWLAERVLGERRVIAVAGTHGKTTTTAMIAWILECAGLCPGFHLGGVASNFGVSARLGSGPFFVAEADEYDTAFFDKRAKFIHYRPEIAVLNNLEFDHADIFPNLAAIQRQFHYFVRTVPGNGCIIANGSDDNLTAVLEQGCWTPVERFYDPRASASPTAAHGPVWICAGASPDYGRFDVYVAGERQGTVRWALRGAHNAANALAALAAARRAGVPVRKALDALGRFRSVKRRMELIARIDGVHLYDDFAHHPTAIRRTLEALRAGVGRARIFAVLEPRSNSMRMGLHRDRLGAALDAADRVLLYRPPGLAWDLGRLARGLGAKAAVFDSVDAIVETLAAELKAGDHAVIMSNGAFGGIQGKLLERLRA